ncbi:MAG: transposase [Terricaulis sp.]
MTRLEVISVGARQRWTPERKRALVLETFEPGAKVNAVARRNGVATSLLFAWRKQMREELGFAAAEPGPRFLPLAVAAATNASTLELELAGGARLRITGCIDADLVAATIKALARR